MRSKRNTDKTIMFHLQMILRDKILRNMYQTARWVWMYILRDVCEVIYLDKTESYRTLWNILWYFYGKDVALWSICPNLNMSDKKKKKDPFQTIKINWNDWLNVNPRGKLLYINWFWSTVIMHNSPRFLYIKLCLQLFDRGNQWWIQHFIFRTEVLF